MDVASWTQLIGWKTDYTEMRLTVTLDMDDNSNDIASFGHWLRERNAVPVHLVNDEPPNDVPQTDDLTATTPKQTVACVFPNPATPPEYDPPITPDEPVLSSKQKARNRRKTATTLPPTSSTLARGCNMPAEPTPEPEPEKAALEPVTATDMALTVSKHLRKKGMAVTLSILGEFGVARAGEVPPEKIPEFVARLNQSLDT